MSNPLMLIAADIGNVNTKYRRQGGAWESEPSLVRLFSTRTGYEFTTCSEGAVNVNPRCLMSGGSRSNIL